MDGPRIYNLFPTLVGPVARWSEHLPRIAGMAFDWIYVNPFTTPGRSGSLYAVSDYRSLAPALRGETAESDGDVLLGFTSAAARHGIRVMADLVVNHTADDAPLVMEHPEWYRREPDGTVAHPFAVDADDPERTTVWTDLAELDYGPRPERDALVAYVTDVALHYASLGFTGFRCDAAYKIPGNVWQAIINGVRAYYPETAFFAETLGGPPDDVRQLGPAGFDYFFNSVKWWDLRAPWFLEQYDAFRTIAPSIGFPESHDTPRLASERPDDDVDEVEREYRFCYLLAATISSGVMMPIGYEFGFRRALDVVATTPAAWETPRFDLTEFVGAVNRMKAASRPLNEDGRMRLVSSGIEGLVALAKSADRSNERVLLLVNPHASEAAGVPISLLRELGGPRGAIDLSASLPGMGDAVDGDETFVPARGVRVFATHPATGDDDATARDDLPVSDEASPAAEDVVANLVAAAAEHPRMRAVVIENVAPQIEGGRYPVKRIAGETFVVEADIFREGHDAVQAVLRYRTFGEDGWRERPMTHVVNDRWRGDFALDRNARYEYTLEAWPDAFGTWHHDTEKKRDAGQPIALELIEGRALLEAALARATAPELARLRAVVRELDAAGEAARAEQMLAAGLAALVASVPDRSGSTRYPRALEVFADRPLAQFASWYELFPRSQTPDPARHGTFADAAKRLPAIAAMGFDVVYLPPIHPIGHAFRKGKNNSLDPGPGDPGSPWAIGNADGGHMAVEPKLGTVADFERFVRAARTCGLEVALDYALQCSPDHPYVRDHPQWFTVRPDGSIKYAENPPKKYQDIVNFDWYGPEVQALWRELRDVVEFWIARGVTIFRVDNPHTKPFAFWEWMIRDVQSRRPEVLFLAEAFTRPKVMQQLAKVGFTMSYTYFTWRNVKWEIEQYLTELSGEMGEYYRPNFWPNTPDILPPFLQTGGRPAFRIRLALAATLSSLYGIYSGFELSENAALPGREEYLDSEKYEIRVRDYDAPGNLNIEIGTWNRIRRENPALQEFRNVAFHETGDEDVIAFSKRTGSNALYVIVLLDPLRGRETAVRFPLARLGLASDVTFETDELLSGHRERWTGDRHRVGLEPERNPVIVYRIDMPSTCFGP